MKKINKKYVFGTVFLLTWFLTMLHTVLEGNYLKLFIVTSIYFYIGAVTAMIVRVREQYQQLQTSTGEEHLIAKGNFENEVSLVILMVACTVVEISYCCLQGFATSSFLHGLVCTASFFPTIYFVIALVFQKRCHTLTDNAKSLAGIEMDETVMRIFKPSQKSLVAIIILLNLFSIIGYFRSSVIEMLFFGSVCSMTIVSIPLDGSKSRVKKALYQMEGVEKKFHLDVLSYLEDSYHLLVSAVVFATASGFLVAFGAMASEATVLLLAGVVTVVNLCFSISNMDYVKLVYLARELEETKKQEFNEKKV